MTSSRGRAGLALLLIVGLAACAGGDPAGAPGVRELTVPAGPDRAVIAERLGRDVVVPGYRALATATAALAGSLAACTPGAVPDGAAEAHRRARSAWFATAAYRFGPAMDLDADSAIAFPADPAKIDALLADGDAPVSEADVSRRGSDQRGLDAIGHVLGRGPRTARACSYLTAASALVAAKADAVARAWTEPSGGEPSALDQLRAPGGDSMWADPQEVMADLVNGPIAALNLAADRQLGPVAGAGGALPDASAAPTVQDITATVGSARLMVDGGLGELVRAQSAATATRLDRQLADSATALAAVPAAPDGRPSTGEPVERAYGQVRAARITLRTEVASQLGVTLSFSDSDGDS